MTKMVLPFLTNQIYYTISISIISISIMFGSKSYLKLLTNHYMKSYMKLLTNHYMKSYMKLLTNH